jgi:hypothetical protein
MKPDLPGDLLRQAECPKCHVSGWQYSKPKGCNWCDERDQLCRSILLAEFESQEEKP